jgi:mRNA interferase MazF
MPNYSKGEVNLIRYPFSDLSQVKVRPAVIINARHVSQDLIITPITSRINDLMSGEFQLAAWRDAGLNVPSAIKRGIYTVQRQLCLKTLGQLSSQDQEALSASLKQWLGL